MKGQGNNALDHTALRRVCWELARTMLFSAPGMSDELAFYGELQRGIDELRADI